MKTAIRILDAMIEELNPEGFIPSNTDSIVTSYLREAKERIQKETSTESNKRYFIFFYSAKEALPTGYKQGARVYGCSTNDVFPKYSEVLEAIRNLEEIKGTIFINSFSEVSKDDYHNFMDLPLPPNE